MSLKPSTRCDKAQQGKKMQTLPAYSRSCQQIRDSIQEKIQKPIHTPKGSTAVLLSARLRRVSLGLARSANSLRLAIYPPMICSPQFATTPVPKRFERHNGMHATIGGGGGCKNKTNLAGTVQTRRLSGSTYTNPIPSGAYEYASTWKPLRHDGVRLL